MYGDRRTTGVGRVTIDSDDFGEVRPFHIEVSAWEQPQLFCEEMRDSFRSLR